MSSNGPETPTHTNILMLCTTLQDGSCHYKSIDPRTLLFYKTTLQPNEVLIRHNLIQQASSINQDDKEKNNEYGVKPNK